MCLFKKHKLPRFSFKPIVCYKVLHIRDYDIPSYYTPFMRIGVELNSYIVAKDKWYKYIKSEFVASQGVHAYSYLDTALRNIGSGHVVVRAIIPPFTFYWENPWGSEIAAAKMYITDDILRY